MTDDRIHALTRLIIAAIALSYLVVLLTGLVQGAAVEEALLKATAAMLSLGALGWVALTLVDAPEPKEPAEGSHESHRRLDVALSATPDETIGVHR